MTVNISSVSFPDLNLHSIIDDLNIIAQRKADQTWVADFDPRINDRDADAGAATFGQSSPSPFDGQPRWTVYG
jgi:hypothetical protein